MALNARKTTVMNTLTARQNAGTIKPGGLAKLEELRAVQAAPPRKVPNPTPGTGTAPPPAGTPPPPRTGGPLQNGTQPAGNGSLTPGQQQALKTLNQRAAAGTIKAKGIERRAALKAQKASGNPAVKGPILGQQPTTPAGTPPPADPNAPAPEPDFYDPGQLPSGDKARVEITGDPGKKIIDKASDVTGTIYQDWGLYHDQAVGDAMKGLDMNGLPQAPWSADLAGERSRIEGDLYNKYTRNFDEEKKRAYEAKTRELGERGISPGSGELYNNEMNRFDREWNQRYDDARLNATAQGGAEWERSYGIGERGRASALGEQVLERQFPLEQMGRLLGQSSITAPIAMDKINNKQDLRMLKKQIAGQIKVAEAQGNIALRNSLAQIDAQLNASLALRGGGGSEDEGVPFPDTGTNPSDFEE